MKELEKLQGFFKAFSIGLWLIYIYYYSIEWFIGYGLHHPIVDHIMLSLVKLRLFKEPYIGKVVIIVFWACGTIGEHGAKKNIKTPFWSLLMLNIFATLIFFLTSYITYSDILYMIVSSISYILFCFTFALFARKIFKIYSNSDMQRDSFEQMEKKLINEDSINIPTVYYHKKRKRKGWINIVSPFRATMVLGVPGSGKSYAVYYNYITQMIEKGYALYVYDYKFDDLTKIVYNHLRLNTDKYKNPPEFYVINFDDPAGSNRANPLSPAFLDDIIDAYESAYTIMINLNKSWVQKQGDFFVESPIVLMTAIIWFLKLYKDGKYCTLPHAIEMLMKPYESLFPILTSYKELKSYMSAFVDAWEGGAQDQLQGQIASARIPLARLDSPAIYWVMSANDFSLDINNPEHPKILCVGNNPDRQNIYGTALALYNARIFKIINRKNRMKSAVLLDELPTIFIKGLDNLIATARSNKVAIVAGAQDFSQIIRDYGDKEAKVIMNTIGNIFSGQVRGETADTLAKMFGKEYMEKESISVGKDSRSSSFSKSQEEIIPASVINSLSQGSFVGVVADSFEQQIDKKYFNATIQVDTKKVKQEEDKYVPLPILATSDNLSQTILDNYKNIKSQVDTIIEDELRRI